MGVYGFVFHRDGEWFHTIIDDKLYLITPDWYEASDEERGTFERTNGPIEGPRKYRETLQRGSRALYFAQCREENETWLPLLEKAFAKAHGDFKSIEGGFTGEGIEDLTGGVTTKIASTDILDKEQFWRDEILLVNKAFLFSCSTGSGDGWRGNYNFEPRQGIISSHAYSVIDAVERKGVRLLKLRNPWGKSEWKGPWSDGSEQWTPEWMEALKHTFGDDGIFWISYEDVLDKFDQFERTRLFDETWAVVQQWTSATVPYSADYNATKFQVVVTKTTPAVFVLSQLDSRYFTGLEGEYIFELRFRLMKEGEDDYIVRSQGDYFAARSTSTDLPELEAGTYSILMKITAKRVFKSRIPEKVIRDTAQYRTNKLIQIGLSYDLAHAKGKIVETEEEKEARLQMEQKKKAVAKAKARENESKRQKKVWNVGKRLKARRKRDAAKKQAYLEKQAAKQKATDGADVEEDTAGDTKPNGTADEQEENAVDGAQTNGDVKNEAEVATSGVEKVQRLPTPPAESADAPDEQPTTNGNAADGEDKIVDVEVTEETVAENPPEAENNEEQADGEPEPAPGTAEDDYLYDSDGSFQSSIDSVLDFAPDDDTEDEAEAAPEVIADDDEDIEFASDPWNAVCVVGFRVYSKDPDCSIKVIRPKPDDESFLEEDDPSKGVSAKEKIDESQVDNTEEVITGLNEGQIVSDGDAQ